MIRKHKDGIDYLEFHLLQNIPNLTHGVLLRNGGVSPPPYDSLNFVISNGDRVENVRANYQKVQNTFSLPKIVRGHQVHSANVQWADETSPTELLDTDGLITKSRNVALFIKHADCQAALFVDPVTKIIANAHSGWRGSVQNIYAKVIEKFIESGSNPKDILVCISPSLGPDRSEFVNYKTELPEEFYPFQFKPNYFNFWEISRYQLENLGIKPEHIEIASICTYENPQEFFSYRREKVSGRNGSFISFVN